MNQTQLRLAGTGLSRAVRFCRAFSPGSSTDDVEHLASARGDLSHAFQTVLLLVLFTVFNVAAADLPGPLRFEFGAGEGNPGWTRVAANDRYSAERGFGFEAGANIETTNSVCTSRLPFFFSVKLPEGNHLVTLVLGNSNAATTNTIKAELRRLMLEDIVTAPEQFTTQTCVVNIRTPRIQSDSAVRLKQRERESEMWNWDEKLTLEFNGAQPSVRSIEIAPAPEIPTVFLLGDSTVCDQPGEPWNSWGQMLPRFFKSTIAVANHANSGESLKSSLSAKRLDKVASQLRPGDFVFIQFGHNDMKDKATNALAQYKSNLERYVAVARAAGATPVLVTSMERKAGVERDTLGKYPETVRTVAQEQSVALIDLHAMSKRLYRALGGNLDRAFQDGTHHNNFGSYQLAKCVVLGIQEAKLDLARHIVPGFSFDPERPDSPEQFQMPASPGRPVEKPLGD